MADWLEMNLVDQKVLLLALKKDGDSEKWMEIDLALRMVFSDSVEMGELKELRQVDVKVNYWDLSSESDSENRTDQNLEELKVS
jgi:hypothetical protein